MSDATLSEAPVLGKLVDDEWAKILETGYSRFFTESGIQGLAKVEDNRLDILAVHSITEGRGHLRDFITDCKGAYNRIYVWSIWNDTLAAALQRYGFTPIQQLIDGELEKGMCWLSASNESEA